MELFIARDKENPHIDAKLSLFGSKPIDKGKGIWLGHNVYELDYSSFLEVTYENSPRKVKIELV